MSKVGDFSEGELLKQIVPLLPTGDFTQLGPGDDCAVVGAPSQSFMVTTDTLVEGEHFTREWSTAAQVGARAAAQNLADVAAMGARPTSLVVSLVLPADLDAQWVRDFAAGLASEVYPTGAGIVGGDLTRGPLVVVTIAAHGTSAGRVITRDGAKAGDTLAVAGTLGQAACGLAALSSGAVPFQLQGDQVPYPFTVPVELFRTPQPPLDAGPLAARLGATAMMDISDGLVQDADRMARASGVRVDLTRRGLAPDLGRLGDAGRALGVDPLDWVLYGGEDHGLLIAFPPYVLVTDPFRAIGTIGAQGVSEDALSDLVTLEGVPVRGGFDHFRRA